MELLGFLTGPAGAMYSASSIITILVLMFIVSVRLYLSRRKKAYVSFTLSLVILIVQYALALVHLIGGRDASPTDVFGYQLLQIVAFLLIHLGVYQLYNRSGRRDFAVFFGLMLITVVLAFVFMPSAEAESASRPEQLLHFVGLDVYLLLLVFLCFYVIPPYIGQTMKFKTGLLVYFLAHLSHIVNRYVYDESHAVYAAAENLLPIVYFCILFVFLFDRVVEILQAVYQSSITDGLTGLYNRHFFFKRVDQYAARKLKIGVIFTDIDNFKKLNDTEGHQTGDAKLKQVAAILREEAEDIGIAGRYGGEELVMLVTDPQANVKRLAEEVRKRVEEETGVTVSVGWSVHKGNISGQTLIKQADEAMYASKTSGKNKVTGYRELKASANRVPDDRH